MHFNDVIYRDFMEIGNNIVNFSTVKTDPVAAGTSYDNYESLILRFKEELNVESWNDDLPNLTERFIKLFPYTIQIEQSNPFYDTDLVVFDDDFDGILPLNGIKKNEFDEINEYYKQVMSGKTRIKFIKNGIPLTNIDDPDMIKTAECFKKLFTRSVGREILIKTIKLNSDLNLQFDLTPGFEPGLKNNIMYFDVNYNRMGVYTIKTHQENI